MGFVSLNKRRTSSAREHVAKVAILQFVRLQQEFEFVQVHNKQQTRVDQMWIDGTLIDYLMKG